MGMHGSVVIHPVGGRALGRKGLEAAARDILRAFERTSLLPPGTADAAATRPATAVVGCEEFPAGVAGIQFGADRFAPMLLVGKWCDGCRKVVVANGRHPTYDCNQRGTILFGNFNLTGTPPEVHFDRSDNGRAHA